MLFLLPIVWLDTRTSATVERLVNETPTNDAYYWQVSRVGSRFNTEQHTLPSQSMFPPHEHLPLQRRCGLPISTYFSGVKLRWLLDNVDTVREEAASGACASAIVQTPSSFNRKVQLLT
jgi:glycerol kinase